MLEIYNELIENMFNHSIQEYPTEACGIITKNFRYIPCKNLSARPKTSFIVDPLKLIEYDGDIWGVYHSHPGDENPYPSANDLKKVVVADIYYIVGFNKNFYLYYYDKKVGEVIYEKFQDSHIKLS